MATFNPVFTDEYIDHWGIVFEVNNLFAKGIQFADFLLNPEQILEAKGFGTAMPIDDEFYPLLDKQRAVQNRQDQIDDAEQYEQEQQAREARRGHVIEMHGGRNMESRKKRAPIKKWKACGNKQRRAS